jgi:hypothetical protein
LLLAYCGLRSSSARIVCLRLLDGWDRISRTAQQVRVQS